MSDVPSRTTEHSQRKLLTRTVVIAGLLGGVLGGVASFAAGRVFKPAKPEVTKTANEEAIKDARDVVEQLLAYVKSGKYDEFMDQVKRSYTYQEQDFEEMKKLFVNSRLRYPQWFGQPMNQFELLRETAYSPDLIQLIYMERFDHGCPIWRFVLYRGQEHWRIAFLGFDLLMEKGSFLPASSSK